MFACNHTLLLPFAVPMVDAVLSMFHIHRHCDGDSIPFLVMELPKGLLLY